MGALFTITLQSGQTNTRLRIDIAGDVEMHLPFSVYISNGWYGISILSILMPLFTVLHNYQGYFSPSYG